MLHACVYEESDKTEMLTLCSRTTNTPNSSVCAAFVRLALLRMRPDMFRPFATRSDVGADGDAMVPYSMTLRIPHRPGNSHGRLVPLCAHQGWFS